MAKGIALAIGLNRVDPAHYEGWDGQLTACEADAEDMARIAKSQGFAVTTLLTAAATRAAVKNAIGEAAKQLGSGDMFMVTYSGHGGQVPDTNGDELDNEDETWCLFDGQVVDDEIYVLWGNFAEGVRILVLSDSCHSGTVVRMAKAMAHAEGATGRVLQNFWAAVARGRYMPPEVALRTYRANREFYDNIQRNLPNPKDVNVKACVRLISGCQDNQTSEDGQFNGLFTGNLLRVWNDGGFSGNYAEFHKAIVRRMPPYQTPNHYVVGKANPAFDGQKPFSL
jgi:metacaspase-1